MRSRLLILPLAVLIFGWSAVAQARSAHATHGTFTRLWSASISPNADSAPAYIGHVRLAKGKHAALLYVLAGNNGSNCNPGDPVRRATLYAIDAAIGKTRWTRGTTGPSRCTTAGPVADPSGAWVYAPGLDGKVHRYAAASGAETNGHGWPHRITLMPDVEKMASPLTIGPGYLYATTSGFIGDQGHYEGHLVAIKLSSGKGHVFNSLCSNIRRLLGPRQGSSNYCADVQSGLFGRGQGVVDPVNHDVYVVSGNGPWNGHTNWGDSILKLDPSGAHLLDTYTPTNQNDLNNQDQDLGSTGPALLPPMRSGGRTYHLLVQGGKGPACGNCDGAALRLLNRDNLSGRNGPGHLGGDLAITPAPGGCEVLTAPAIWKGPSFPVVVYANDCGTAGYRVTAPSAGHFRLKRIWSTGRGGTTPVVHGGVLYTARDGNLTAYNPANGTVLGSTAAIGGIHWEYPLVVGKRLYISDNAGHVFAFAVHVR
jgi:outer membrane protein assembly factor BamB